MWERLENVEAQLENVITRLENVGAQLENVTAQLENVEAPRTLRELFAPIATNTPSCIVLLATNATHFDLKFHVIQLIPSFHGLENEEPYSHVKTFLDICSTFRYQNFFDESVRLGYFLFPYMVGQKLGCTPTCLDPSPLGKPY
jgi:hypothetical protein